MNKIMKPLVAAAIPLLTAGGSWLITGEVNDWAKVWLGVTGVFMALAVVGATLFLPDEEDAALMKWYQTWGKTIAAAVTPLVSAGIQALATGSFSRTEWATTVVGVATAALMAYVNNTPDS